MQAAPTLEGTITELFSCANSRLVEYCILRNFEALPESTLGGDIDLVLKEGDAAKWEEVLKEVARKKSMHVGVIQTHYHGKRYCLVNFDAEIFLKLDVHFGEFWRGVEYSSCEELLKNKEKYKFFYVPSVVNRSLVCLLDPLLTGGATRKKYKCIIMRCIAEERACFLERMSEIVGARRASEVVTLLDDDRYLEISNKVNLIRMSLWVRKIFSRARTSTKFFGYIHYELRRRISPLGTLIELEGDTVEVKGFLSSFQEFSEKRFLGMTADLVWPKPNSERRSNGSLIASLTNYNMVLGSRQSFSRIMLRSYMCLTRVRIVKLNLAELEENNAEFCKVGFSKIIEDIFRDVILQYKIINNI
ncbi:hypothetical protein NBRC116493_17800 [Aurantivibrio infirmus]